ncbi:MAG: flagellar biosynthesis anti-sigma factor FlgM [Bacteriovoracaceae bacterium]|jgi:negative regulator of flagellin synthesis FlgM|nr:flagellar biosynthesis anti-sigma factor FlgM [Halobacteriovoraceae bacterium]MDP7321801.1 flagellar biosynthesis anti-sigma factor FlgM [Bacteriovoracaceae bacterium]
MNNNIDTRAPFFPNSKTAQREIDQAKKAQQLRRNTYERAQELNNQTAKDAKVTIPDSIRDFSRIKKAVDTAPEVNNQEKIAQLKAQIQAGTYQPNYDAIADKILASEY